MTDLPEPLFRAFEAGTGAYTYRGVPCVKNPIDMAIVAKLLWDVKPKTIIEVGSGEGGSAIWMRDLMSTYGVPCRLHSVDINPPRISSDGIYFHYGNGLRLEVVLSDEFMRNIPRPLLMIDDADHFPETTASVLHFFDGWSRQGEYIVVEDGHAEKYYPGCYRGGPLVAIQKFLDKRHACFEIDRRYCDMFGAALSGNPDGYIRRCR